MGCNYKTLNLGEIKYHTQQYRRHHKPSNKANENVKDFYTKTYKTLVILKKAKNGEIQLHRLKDSVLVTCLSSSN